MEQKVHASENRTIATAHSLVELSIFEQGEPPRFRLAFDTPPPMAGDDSVDLETLRPNGTRPWFHFTRRDGYWESIEIIPEPHEFIAFLHLANDTHQVAFEEHVHEHGTNDSPSSSAHRDNNIRSAYIHVKADEAVSVLAIAA